MSNSLDFQVDIPKGSNTINVSSVSALADEGTTKLNYLIKALLAEFANKIKFIKEEFEKHKEAKKREIDVLLFKEKREKAKIEKYQQELSELKSKIKLLQESKDNSPSKEYFLNKLSVENDYRNTFQKYFELNKNAKYSLFGIQKKITELSKEITNLKKTKDNIKADPFLQSDLYKIQKDIINVSKELKTLEKGKNNIPNDSNYGKKLSATQKSIAKISKELKKLEKEKMNIQSIQIIQPPVATELPKNIKIKSNVALSLVVGFFLMFFLSFLLEYIGKYKSSLKHKQPLGMLLEKTNTRKKLARWIGLSPKRKFACTSLGPFGKFNQKNSSQLCCGVVHS